MLYTNMQFRCWAGWCVDMLDTSRSGPCELGCSSGAGRDGVSTCWTHHALDHANWDAVQVLGGMVCRHAGHITLWTMRTGMQFRCWAGWCVDMLDTSRSGPCELGCSSGAGRDGVSTCWTHHALDRANWDAVQVLGGMVCRHAGHITLWTMRTGMQFRCWAGWCVDMLDTSRSGPCELGCSSGAGLDGVSTCWTHHALDHANWDAVQVLGGMVCRHAGHITIWTMRTGMQFRCWAGWCVDMLDTSRSGPCELGCSSGAGRDGVSTCWTHHALDHANWDAVQVLGGMVCRHAGHITLWTMRTGMQFRCWVGWCVDLLNQSRKTHLPLGAGQFHGNMICHHQDMQSKCDTQLSVACPGQKTCRKFVYPSSDMRTAMLRFHSLVHVRVHIN